jgi:hypothetical protein
MRALQRYEEPSLSDPERGYVEETARQKPPLIMYQKVTCRERAYIHVNPSALFTYAHIWTCVRAIDMYDNDGQEPQEPQGPVPCALCTDTPPRFRSLTKTDMYGSDKRIALSRVLSGIGHTGSL